MAKWLANFFCTPSPSGPNGFDWKRLWRQRSKRVVVSTKGRGEMPEIPYSSSLQSYQPCDPPHPLWWTAKLIVVPGRAFLKPVTTVLAKVCFRMAPKKPPKTIDKLEIMSKNFLWKCLQNGSFSDPRSSRKAYFAIHLTWTHMDNCSLCLDVFAYGNSHITNFMFQPFELPATSSRLC